MESEGRQDLLRAAVHFLQNPKISTSTLSSKRTFLLNKGLKEEEIDEAINLALANLTAAVQPTPGTTSLLSWKIMLLFGSCYGAYTLYKMYSLYKDASHDHLDGPGGKSTGKEPVDKISDVQHQRTEIIRPTETLSLADIMKRINDIQRLMEAQKSILAGEIQSIKSLMLNHNQFEGPPSIPPWQFKKDDKDKSSELEK